jgi:nitroimidazol reductase NimA-like FMN-containing flavoprotein (pyridoxamine 5'-phosphate oxidase superfamily)
VPKDYAALPVTEVRRADRAVEDEAWIKEMLHRAAMGTLATVFDGQPFINMNLFVYDETAHCIFMHTARYGRTQVNIEAAERVCFSVSEMGRLLPADRAFDFSVEYSGVVVFGQAIIVQDETEKFHAMQLLMNKYAPHLEAGEDYQLPVADELKRTAVYRIAVKEWSGKRKTAPEDFPGAYLYQNVTGH